MDANLVINPRLQTLPAPNILLGPGQNRVNDALTWITWPSAAAVLTADRQEIPKHALIAPPVIRERKRKVDRPCYKRPQEDNPNHNCDLRLSCS
jgi:hypothetical protein